MQPNLKSKEAREAFFSSLYDQCFPAVASYIARRGGELHDTKDIFHDAIISYYERLMSDADFDPLNTQAYIMGACKNLWYQQNKRKSISLPVSGTFDIIQDSTEPSQHEILSYLQATGQKCLDMLKAFYYDKFSMSELAESFGFSSERSATVQKYKCLEKVRNEVKEKSLQYEDFVA